MRIAIDVTPLMKPERTGVARYAENLVNALAEAAPRDEFILCYRLSRFSRRKHRLRLPGPRFTQRWIQGAYRPRKVDVVHTTDGRLHEWKGVPTVVTLHDVFSLESNHFATDGFRKRRASQYAALAESDARILCVSEYTRDAFWRRHQHVAAERLVVIPEGVEDRFHPDAEAGVKTLRAEYGIRGEYALFVGELSLRKNIVNLLDAWAGIPPDGPSLVLAGRHRPDQLDVPGEIARRGLGGRVILTGFFPDQNLPSLYAGATCLVYPSLLEGFGLPVLEAMACGTPVVTSDRGALPEVSGGNAVAVDPEDPESIRWGVLRFLLDPSLIEKMRRRGIEWAALYRWPEVARRTVAVYREVAG